MTTDSIEKRFIDGLQERYDTEQELVDALETLADKSENEAASRAFSAHREETQGTNGRFDDWPTSATGRPAEIAGRDGVRSPGTGTPE